MKLLRRQITRLIPKTLESHIVTCWDRSIYYYTARLCFKRDFVRWYNFNRIEANINWNTEFIFSLPKLPKPVQPGNKIKFDLPKSNFTLSGAKDLFVKLIVYDISREIATLVNEQLIPGTYEVDGMRRVSQWLYFYKLITEDYSETKKWF